MIYNPHDMTRHGLLNTSFHYISLFTFSKRACSKTFIQGLRHYPVLSKTISLTEFPCYNRTVIIRGDKYMADRKKSDSKRKTLSNKTNYHAAFLSSLKILFWQYREQITMFMTLLPTAFDDDIRHFKDPDLPDKAVESFCTFLIIFF